MGECVDVVVVGAGVVGLAVARALAGAGREVLILEAEDGIGTGQSSRNSEVVHAGLYYPTGSHKADLCVRGREQLYAFCRERGVGHARCGKLVVATSVAQQPALRALLQKGLDNGVDDLRWLEGDAARALEPQLRCIAALHSPSTGIVDSHGFMKALLADAEAHGATLVLRAPVQGGEPGADGIALEVGGDSPTQLLARVVVNCAGLSAPAVAAGLRGYPRELVPTAHNCKGSYFALQGKPPFARLVYPMHDKDSLGVHLTLDLGGQARFGPDVEWLSDEASIDYDVDPRRSDGFEAAIRDYWPGLPEGALLPAYSGVRSRITARGEPAADFVILGPDRHGVRGLVQLFGIESPGLTAAMALADRVAAELG